jgi:hypothetical protein
MSYRPMLLPFQQQEANPAPLPKPRRAARRPVVDYPIRKKMP